MGVNHALHIVTLAVAFKMHGDFRGRLQFRVGRGDPAHPIGFHIHHDQLIGGHESFCQPTGGTQNAIWPQPGADVTAGAVNIAVLVHQTANFADLLSKCFFVHAGLILSKVLIGNTLR